MDEDVPVEVHDTDEAIFKYCVLVSVHIAVPVHVRLTPAEVGEVSVRVALLTICPMLPVAVTELVTVPGAVCPELSVRVASDVPWPVAENVPADTCRLMTVKLVPVEFC